MFFRLGGLAATLAVGLFAFSPSFGLAEEVFQVTAYQTLDETIDIYDATGQYIETVNTSAMPVLPLKVVGLARNGELLKIADDLWVRKVDVVTNKKAGVSENLPCLIVKRGKKSDRKEYASRGLSDAECE